MNTIEQAREVSARIWNAGYTDESATIDALIADRNEWRDEALSAQKRFKAAEDKLASIRGQEPAYLLTTDGHIMGARLDAGHAPGTLTKLYLEAGAQPVSHDSIEFRQFLSDVLTAAGLLEHGKQSKGLAERIASGAVRYMAAPVQAQTAPNQEPVALSRLKPFVSGLGKAILDELMGDAAGAQERKPLTDDQITEVWRELRAQKEDWSDLDFARAIEAKIKEQAAPVQAVAQHTVTCQIYGHVVGACSECNTHNEVGAQPMPHALLEAVDALLSNEEHAVSGGMRSYQVGSQTWELWEDVRKARPAAKEHS